MNKIKNWLVYKVLRVIKNYSADYVNSLTQRVIITVKDHYCDKKLGIETNELLTFPKAEASVYKDASVYSPTPYSKLEKMADYLKLTPDDVFVDLGCGKGRTVFFMATQKLKKVIGVEIRKDLADIAKKNLNHCSPNHTAIEIINADVATLDFKEGTVFFMFNPFGRKTFEKVIENISASLSIHPRKIRIVYFNPAYRYLLDSQDWLIPQGQIGYTGIFVWQNKL